MFAVALDLEKPFRMGPAHDARARRLAQILELRNQVAMSRDLLYCPAPIRTLIEEDIPTLVALATESR